MRTSGSEVENKEIVSLFAQAVNTRSRRLLEQVMAANVVRRCLAMQEVQAQCLDNFWDFLQREWENLQDTRIVPEQMVAEGDRVALLATYECTLKGSMGPFSPSGKRFSVHVTEFFRIESGHIAETWVTWDNMVPLSQLGHHASPKPFVVA